MIACLRLPDFAIQVIRQQDPALAGQPLVLAGYSGRAGKVCAASAEAQTWGIRAGMTLSRAYALCPEVQVSPAEGIGSWRALHDLLERLRRFTPKLEPAPPPYPDDACLWLDLGRLPDQEIASLGLCLLETLSDFPAALGLASGKGTSQIAALHTAAGHLTLVRPGTEAAFLAPLPLSSLPLPPELARRFDQLGLQTFGQLAALPSSAVQLHFGPDGARLHPLARGIDRQPVIPHRFEQPICAAQILQGPVTDRATLEGILCELAGQLAERLQTTNQTSQQVILRLALDDGSLREADLTPRQPVAQVPALYRLLLRLLDHCPLSCGIVHVAAELRRLATALPRQLALFADLISAPQHIQEIGERLSLRHDPQHFFTVAELDPLARLPEHAFRLERMEVA